MWQQLDLVVKNLRRIEKYLQDADIEIVYFNMDRDDYKEVFGFEKNELEKILSICTTKNSFKKILEIIKDDQKAINLELINNLEPSSEIVWNSYVPG